MISLLTLQRPYEFNKNSKLWDETLLEFRLKQTSAIKAVVWLAEAGLKSLKYLLVKEAQVSLSQNYSRVIWESLRDTSVHVSGYATCRGKSRSCTLFFLKRNGECLMRAEHSSHSPNNKHKSLLRMNDCNHTGRQRRPPEVFRKITDLLMGGDCNPFEFSY